MSIVWAGGRPVKGEHLRKKKYIPKNYGEPCAVTSCKRQPTKRYVLFIQDEQKLAPLCLECAESNKLV